VDEEPEATLSRGTFDTEEEIPIKSREARDLLERIDRGEHPIAFVTEDDRRILTDAGMSEEDILAKTPDEIIDELRRKFAEEDADSKKEDDETIEPTLTKPDDKETEDADSLEDSFDIDKL
jgi:hypothetical protein